VAQQHEHARKIAGECELDELTAGMVIAANVRMKTGAFVMAANTELDDYISTNLNISTISAPSPTRC
jgi:hypothetical protein